ncbi:hypothetical protein [Paenibacillus sp. GYB003]|uniref:hypothetical protein n=1 Tax=Paenibacillus sp. GYB003 TaxID=2994392 RepID=UPI003FA7ADA7
MELEPNAETYYDELFRLLADAGSADAVRKLYEELRDRLRKDWGVAPSERIARFVERFGP